MAAKNPPLIEQVVLDPSGILEGLAEAEAATRKTTQRMSADFNKANASIVGAHKQLGYRDRDINKLANAASRLGGTLGGVGGELGNIAAQFSAGFLTGGVAGVAINAALLAFGKIRSSIVAAREEAERLEKEAKEAFASSMREARDATESASKALEDQVDILRDLEFALRWGVDPAAVTARRVEAEARRADRMAQERVESLKRAKADIEADLKETQRIIKEERASAGTVTVRSGGDVFEVAAPPTERLVTATARVEELKKQLGELGNELKLAGEGARTTAKELETLVTQQQVALVRGLVAESKRHEERMAGLRLEWRTQTLVAAGEDASVARVRAEIGVLREREATLKTQLKINADNLETARELGEVQNRLAESEAHLANIRRSAQHAADAKLEAARATESERVASARREIAVAEDALRIQREKGVSAAVSMMEAELAMLRTEVLTAESEEERLQRLNSIIILEEQLASLRRREAGEEGDRVAAQLAAARDQTAEMVAARDAQIEADRRGISVEEVRAEQNLKTAQTEYDKLLAMEEGAVSADELALAYERLTQAQINWETTTKTQTVTALDGIKDAALEMAEVLRDAVGQALGQLASDFAMWSRHTAEIEEATRRATEAQLEFGEASELSSRASRNAASEAVAAVAVKVQEVLAGLAQEAAVRSVMELGLGFAALANPITAAGAPLHFAAAGVFAGIAGGAALAGAGIGAVRPATSAEKDELDRANADAARGRGAGAGGGRDERGELTVIVQSNQVYATETDVNRSVREGVEKAGWYD